MAVFKKKPMQVKVEKKRVKFSGFSFNKEKTGVLRVSSSLNCQIKDGTVRVGFGLAQADAYSKAMSDKDLLS